MSRRDNMKRIFVGNLPPDVRTRDLEDLFYKFGKIAFIDLKTRRGPPFAFVEFDDYRDAEEAVRCRDGKEWDGCRLRVEFPRGRERASRFKNGSGSGGGGGGSGGSRSGAPQRRSKFRVKVSGLPSSGSWQDLKDHMREVGEVCYADVYKGGEGVVEFVSFDDMRYAIKKLNNTKFKSHEGESSYIKLREDMASGDSRSRSRSPVASGRRRGSPSYSPVNKRRGDSHSPSRSVSRSPKHRRGGGGGGGDSGSGPRDGGSRSGGAGGSRSGRSGGDHRASKRSSRHRSGRSGSRSRSVSRSQSHSRSPSGTPRSHRGSSPGARSRSRSKSNSRSPRYDKSPIHRSSDKRSRSNSRSPSPAEAGPGSGSAAAAANAAGAASASSADASATSNKLIKRETNIKQEPDNNHKNSRSRSRSKSASRSASRSPINSHKTPSKTPSRTPTPDSIGTPKDA